MKIAVVGPSPVPFVYGGAEKLMLDLCKNINSITKNQAELIKIPVNEFDFWGLIDAYKTFYKLDLSQFDMIITSKYPSWMVCHPNSVCWMMHTLRGLYDTYQFTGLPKTVSCNHEKVSTVVTYINQNSEPAELDTFFDLLEEMRADNSVPAEYYAFPGPLIRMIVHYMDSFGLRNQKRLFGISNVVVNREDYFPKNRVVHAVYPPVENVLTSEGQFEHFFVCSRLDGPKRIDKIIQAYKKSKTGAMLYIAGTGPCRNELEALAEEDSRIKFLGFISDEEKDKYYANSIAVPFVPYDEDYGYITIEAMLHKKPVITLKDSGGATEFVRDGISGFVTDEINLSSRFDFYSDNIDVAKQHGKNAFEFVKKITVERCTSLLVDENSEYCFDDLEKEEGNTSANEDKCSGLVTSGFGVYPPMGGGQARIFNLYKNVAKHYKINLLSSVGFSTPYGKNEISRDFFETTIPRTNEHEIAEAIVTEKVGVPCTDIAMLNLLALSPKYSENFEKQVDDTDFIIFSHPYTYQGVKKHIKNKKFIYEAHNVEYLMKRQMLNNSETSNELLEELFNTEKELCDKSYFIMTCSQEDADKLEELYEVDKSKFIVVPNGVDCDSAKYVSVEERIKNKKVNGLFRKVGIFMGSWHKPNLEACEEIFKIAPKCPDTYFFLMGSQCMYFEQKRTVLPSNVGLLGMVSEKEKERIFSMVDFALNPMMSGSGTNLKMFDYMASGIPVISTPFGTRGIEEKSVCIVANVDNMPEAINEFDLFDMSDMVKNAREYMERVFDWKVIAKILCSKIDEMLESGK